MKTFTVSLLLILLSSVCWGQDSERAKFWSKSTVSLVAADFGAKAADYHFTMTNRDRDQHFSCDNLPIRGYTCWKSEQFVEQNPIARPFVLRGGAVAAGYFVGSAVLDTFAAYELHKHGHAKLSRAVLIIGIGNSVSGAAWSAR